MEILTPDALAKVDLSLRKREGNMVLLQANSNGFGVEGEMDWTSS